jgi:hypothetical protein
VIRRTLQREAAKNTAATRARIFGTDLPDVKITLDSLGVMEEAMRHFYVKALVEKSGPVPGRVATTEALARSECRTFSRCRPLAVTHGRPPVGRALELLKGIPSLPPRRCMWPFATNALPPAPRVCQVILPTRADEAR